MSPQSISEKKPRAYRSNLRQQHAAQTRSQILTAAAELFAAEGYARTTLAKIAAKAGVSAETVQGQGPKAALLIATIEQIAFGVTGEENVFNLEVGRKLVATDGPVAAAAYLAETHADLHEQTAPLALALIGGASSDPELDEYLKDMIASINLQARRVFDVYRDRGWLRPDLAFDEIVETAAVLCSVETYQRIVQRDGWSIPAYQAWLRRILEETVFVPPQSDSVR
jgi:AcrR family transcriptional regulator